MMNRNAERDPKSRSAFRATKVRTLCVLVALAICASCSHVKLSSVVVPNEIGQGLSQANYDLQKLGLKPSPTVRPSGCHFLTVQSFVDSQHPSAGTRVSKGSTVYLAAHC